MIPLTIVRSQWGRYNLPIYIYIWYPPTRPTFLLPWLLWHLSNLQWRCNAIASWMDSRFKIQDSYGLFPANLESRIQDSRFPETLLSKSWIQILNPTPGFKIQDSRFLGTLSSKSWIQDSGFKIQDSQGLFAGNLESRISFVCSAYPGILVPLQVHAANAEQKRPLLSWEARFVRTMVSIHIPSFPASCAIPTGLHFVSASLLSWAGLFDIPPFPSTCPLSMDCTLRSHLLDQVGSLPSLPVVQYPLGCIL